MPIEPLRLMVTGAEGMLGRCVVEACLRDHDVIGVDLRDADLSLAPDVDALFERRRPEWVIHCAAFTDVDGAEARREDARRGNAVATSLLAARCQADGVGLTAVSTDYVFAGDAVEGYDEHDPRDPVNHYGATKAEAEAAVEAMAGGGQIVRTSWLFGPGPRHFVRTIRELLRRGVDPSVVDDQVGSPTYAPDLALVLKFLAEDGTPGRYHGTNAGVCSWFEFAQEIARGCGEDPGRISPCSTAEYPTAAARPACSILRSRNLEALGCPPRPLWRDALGRCLDMMDAEEAR